MTNKNKSLILGGIICLSQLVNAGFKFSGNDGALAATVSTAKIILDENITGFNGTIKLGSSAQNNLLNVASEYIEFNNGKVQVAGNTFDLIKGQYNPQTAGTNATDKITLQDGDVLSISAGADIFHLVEVASAATASIIGTPNFTQEITLAASSTVLQLGLQHKINKNVNYASAGGTVRLIDDLSLMDGVKFVPGTSGTSTLDINNYSLQIGSSGATGAWTGTLTFQRARDIQLNGPVTLGAGVWSFTTSGGITNSYLNGNGNVLTLSHATSRIRVASGHTLYISDIHIKGLSFALGKFDLLSDTATIVLNNVTIDLDGDYTHDFGLIKIAGDKVRFIVGKPGAGVPYKFTVDADANSGPVTVQSRFLVDGQILIYETLGGDNNNPFEKIVSTVTSALTTADTACFPNSGTMRSAITVVLSTDYVINANTAGENDVSTSTFTNNIDLFVNSIDANGLLTAGTLPTRRVLITNDDVTGNVSKTLTIDGGGYTWKFPNDGKNVLIIPHDVTVIMTNILLENFSFENVFFEHATTSKLQFGDSARVSLRKDLALPYSSRPMEFVGTAVLNANGNKITFNGTPGTNSCFKFSVAADDVEIANAVIEVKNKRPFEFADVTSQDATLIFNNSKLMVNEGGLVFGGKTNSVASTDFGKYKFKANCSIEAMVTDAVNDDALANLTDVEIRTSKTVIVDQFLRIGQSVNLIYAPNGNDLTAAERRNRLQIEAVGTLLLDGCTVTTTGMPLKFSTGTIKIDNKVNLTAATSFTGVAAEIIAAPQTEISAVVNFEVLAAGVFNVDGKLKYVA